MKILILAFLFFLSNSYAADMSHKDNIAWTLNYGYGQNSSTRGFSPAGPNYRLSFGGRMEKLELGFAMSYADQKDNVTYSNVNADITRQNISPSVNVGFWVFSALKLHVGYARHYIVEEVKNSGTSSNEDLITKHYQVVKKDTGGLFGGADLVLLQSSAVQLFVNYDYYRLNSMDAHDWQAMAGFRFYFDAKASGSSGTFGKYFDKLFKIK
ncbi:MAG: hypothetical protein K2Q18_09065 [Bdellovibrionales bacterium]|nr:hypothetical protein [Bdellovibrionales bacterium]